MILWMSKSTEEKGAGRIGDSEKEEKIGGRAEFTFSVISVYSCNL